MNPAENRTCNYLSGIGREGVSACVCVDLDVYVGGYGCTYELIPPVLFLIFFTGNYLSTRNVQESHDAHLLHAWLHF